MLPTLEGKTTVLRKKNFITKLSKLHYLYTTIYIYTHVE